MSSYELFTIGERPVAGLRRIYCADQGAIRTVSHHLAVSHELASFEGANIGRREDKPFTTATLLGESPVPITLDTVCIVRSNRVNELQFLWKLDRNLSGPSFHDVRFADLVPLFSTYFHKCQIDVAVF